jgi:GNAT superfamily N-acetyltransferase
MDASTRSKLELRIIPFSEWRREISPLWLMEGSYTQVTHTLNGYGQMQYVGREYFQRVLLFPIAAELEGERIGWTSIFNTSDEAVRVRGIYVLPEFRSNGVGWTMVHYAMSLWPDSWKRCFMYARASNVERYQRWGFTIVPDHSHRSFEQGEALNDREIVLMQKAMGREKNIAVASSVACLAARPRAEADRSAHAS